MNERARPAVLPVSDPDQTVGLRQSSHSMSRFNDGAEGTNRPQLSTNESLRRRAGSTTGGPRTRVPAEWANVIARSAVRTNH